MPPKMQLMPGTRMTTRPSNKDKRPGLILLGNQRRTAEEANQLREEATRHREAEERRLTTAIENIAQIEDRLREKEDALELERRQRREELQNKETDTGSTVARKKTGKKDKKNEDEASNAITSNMRSKRPERAVAAKGTKLTYDEEEPVAPKGDCDFEYDEEGDDPEAETDEEEEDASDASSIVAKKRKNKVNKKGRKDVEAMRQSVASNTVRAQRFDEPAKRKAVPDDTGPGLASTSKQKKQKKDDLTGFDPEWEAVIKKRALLKKTKVATMAADTDAPDADEDSMVHYGGFVGDNEDDTGEAAAAREQVVKFKKPQSIRIEDKPMEVPKTMKEVRGGDEKWQDKHLPADAKLRFKEEVVPRIRQLLGSLDPWEPLTPEHVQKVLDDVFGEGKYQATRNEVFFNLAKMRMENWRNGFSQAAVLAVKSLISDNADILTTAADVKELIKHYLSKVQVKPDSDHQTYAYQWAEWEENGTERKGFCQNPLILRTFGNAHLAQIEGFENLEKERPIGALLMAMQAVGRALEIWTDGEKPIKKPPAFSADNYGDTFVKVDNNGGRPKRRKIRRATFFVSTVNKFDSNTWNTIITEARDYLPEAKKRRSSTASSVTVIADADDIDDPDVDFVMAF